MASVFEISAGKALGYTTGGAVTQTGQDKTAGVTLNQSSGQITTTAGGVSGGSEATFTVTCDKVAATDVVVVSLQSGMSTGTYIVSITAVAAGSFDVTINNVGSTAAEALVLNYAVIKASAS